MNNLCHGNGAKENVKYIIHKKNWQSHPVEHECGNIDL